MYSHMKTRTSYAARNAVILGIIAVLVMAAALPAASADAAATDIHIPAGQDSFHISDARFNIQIPADFFGPGSDPFGGAIICVGGNTDAPDTIIERKSDMDLPRPPSSDTIPIEIIELQLVSCQPIVVTFNDGSQQQWNVRVDLSPTVPQPGEMTVTRTDAQGGTFDAQLPVQPLFTFTPVDGGEIIEPGAGTEEQLFEPDVDEVPLNFGSEYFEFSAHNVLWSVCPDTESDFCPGPIAFNADNSWINLIPLPIPPNLPDETCEFPLPNGGIVVLPTPKNPNPSSDHAQGPNQLRRSADRLEAHGLADEANRLRLLAETIETIQQTCENLNDTPP